MHIIRISAERESFGARPSFEVDVEVIVTAETHEEAIALVWRRLEGDG